MNREPAVSEVTFTFSVVILEVSAEEPSNCGIAQVSPHCGKGKKNVIL